MRVNDVVDIGWPDGIEIPGLDAAGRELAEDGCLRAVYPTGDPGPGVTTDGLFQCDEFPNAAMEAGGGSSNPRPAVRWSPKLENLREGGKLLAFYNACGITHRNETFLVIPLVAPEFIPDFVLPNSFHECNKQN